MTKLIIKATAGAGILAAIVFFLANGMLLSYDLIGFDLDLGQRDFRIWNNFSDASANDNTTPDIDFGGLDGAELALSKGAMEWGSEPVGGSSWGDGGANFDCIYVGNTNTAGGYSANIMSADPGNGGNVIAYTYPSGGGWKMRFYENWKWYDGPGSTPSGSSNMDLQGICAHEYGHALGLDHTSVSSATMYAYASGTGNTERTIENDDKNGLKAIYGTASSTKPHISSLSGGTSHGDTLTINGSNFSSSGNEVWFTGSGGTGAPTKVTSVSSSSGGTKIDVTIPNGANDGFVAVKKSGTSHSSLSNVYPLDIGGTGPVDDPVPDVKINGSDNPASIHTSEWATVTISLEANDSLGDLMDWWVYVERSGNFWWCEYKGGSPKWNKSVAPIRFAAANLVNFNNYVVLGPRTFPTGIYEFTFSIDDWDGIKDDKFTDSCSIVVYN